MVSKMGDNEHYINEMFVNMIDLLAEKLDFRSSTVGKVLGSTAHPPTPFAVQWNTLSFTSKGLR